MTEHSIEVDLHRKLVADTQEKWDILKARAEAAQSADPSLIEDIDDATWAVTLAASKTEV